MFDTFTRYLPRMLESLLVSVRIVLLGALLIRGSDEPLMSCPPLLHWTMAGGLPGLYLTVTVSVAPLPITMSGLAGLLVIFGAPGE